MANSSPEILLSRLIESSDIYINALNHVLGQSFESPMMSSGLLHGRVALVQEWRDNWSSILKSFADSQ